MVLNQTKGFTLMEFMVVVSVMMIIYLMSIQGFGYYVENSLNQKRLENTRMIAAVFKDIVEKKGDIPKNYCTSNGNTYDDSCFSSLYNGCTTEIICNASNNFCGNSAITYYDFKKLFSDENYNITAFPDILGENYPEGFNYKLCPNSSTDFAYTSISMPKETSYLGDDVSIKNPSFIFKIYQNGVNKIINKSSYY